MSKTAVVTGASGSIGFEILKTLAFLGFDVIAQYNTREISENYNEIGKYSGVRVTPVKCDFSSADDIKNFCDFLEKQEIEVLVNNAGMSLYGLYQDGSADDIEKILSVNLKAPMLISRSVIKNMISAKRGNIVNISSVWGETGASCETAYSATKAGIIGFTKALAKEVAPSGIRVNCISPGVIKTDMLNIFSKDDLSALEEEIPLGRLGTPRDVASAVAFILSDAAKYITGEILRVNGGFYM